jgi:very-short-patch-repair endonuclease
MYSLRNRGKEGDGIDVLLILFDYCHCEERSDVAISRSPAAHHLPADLQIFVIARLTTDSAFRRQRPIGDYIVDFYCAKAKLVIELDGSGHYTDAGRRYDARRTAYLESLCLRVIRFSNHDAEAHFDRTCRHIDVEIRSRISKNILRVR